MHAGEDSALKKFRAPEAPVSYWGLEDMTTVTPRVDCSLVHVAIPRDLIELASWLEDPCIAEMERKVVSNRKPKRVDAGLELGISEALVQPLKLRSLSLAPQRQLSAFQHFSPT